MGVQSAPTVQNFIQPFDDAMFKNPPEIVIILEKTCVYGRLCVIFSSNLLYDNKVGIAWLKYSRIVFQLYFYLR